MNNSNDILFEIKHLKKYFPVRRGLLRRAVGYVKAVDGVSLAIERGKTLGLVGETGSGKTTLGRLILRLLEADSGEVWFEGKNVLTLRSKELKELRKDLQIIFQDPYGSLNPRMKVGGIIAEGLKIFHQGTKLEIEERVKKLLQTVGLPRKPSTFIPMSSVAASVRG